MFRRVRDLGVLLDNEPSTKQHSKVASTCYYHLRRLRQIRSYASHEIMIQPVMSLVMSRIYCNSVVVGRLASTLSPLQRVQNSAAIGLFSALVGNLI